MWEREKVWAQKIERPKITRIPSIGLDVKWEGAERVETRSITCRVVARPNSKILWSTNSPYERERAEWKKNWKKNIHSHTTLGRGAVPYAHTQSALGKEIEENEVAPIFCWEGDNKRWEDDVLPSPPPPFLVLLLLSMSHLLKKEKG
jgi:hypothetical protein